MDESLYGIGAAAEDAPAEMLDQPTAAFAGVFEEVWPDLVQGDATGDDVCIGEVVVWIVFVVEGGAVERFGGWV